MAKTVKALAGDRAKVDTPCAREPTKVCPVRSKEVCTKTDIHRI
jgi:hypothetical protein